MPVVAVPGAELLGLAGPLGDQTGEPAGNVLAGGPIGVAPPGATAGAVPAGETNGIARAGSPGDGGIGMALSGGGPGGFASDGSLTPAG